MPDRATLLSEARVLPERARRRLTVVRAGAYARVVRTVGGRRTVGVGVEVRVGVGVGVGVGVEVGDSDSNSSLRTFLIIVLKLRGG